MYITPGTKFMNDLDEYMSKMFQTNEFVTFDGSCNKGEENTKYANMFEQ